MNSAEKNADFFVGGALITRAFKPLSTDMF